MIDQLSPHDDEAERAVLFCFLQDKSTIPYVFDVYEEDFYKEEHQELFRAIIDDFENIDWVTVPKKLRSVARSIMGDFYLKSNIKSYIEELKAISNSRKLYKLSMDIKRKVNENKDPIVIKNYVEDTLKNIRGNRSETIVMQNIDISKQYQDYLDFDKSKMLRTGWKDLDDKIIGFFPGSFVAIGGIPKVGKTTFMLNIVSNMCHIQKKKVLLLSLEMPETAIQAKLVSYLTSISTDFQLGMSKYATDVQKKMINEAASKISQYNLYRTGRKGISVEEIDKEIELLGGVDIVFIDYLQKIKPKNHSAKKYDQVTQISNDISMLALKHNIPIVCIVSISREYSKRENKRPILSDFRDSGNIEYDISLALMLNRLPEEENGGTKITEVSIAANRYGSPDGITELIFQSNQSKFYQLGKVD